TSSLTQRETDRLFGLVANLKREGVAVMYISHRLAEVQRVADRAVVLRDGRNAGELAGAQVTHEALVRLMVGREVERYYHRDEHLAPRPVTAPRLELRDVRYIGGPVHPATFQVRAGEIVGMAGLVGAGRTELAECIFGVRRLTSGQLFIDGRPVYIRQPRDA